MPLTFFFSPEFNFFALLIVNVYTLYITSISIALTGLNFDGMGAGPNSSLRGGDAL